jgi:hypothetical protein
MTIVTYRPPRRKRPKSPEFTGPRIVQHRPKGRAWQLTKLEPDAERDAQVEAFFERMGLTLPDGRAG